MQSIDQTIFFIIRFDFSNLVFFHKNEILNFELN